MGLTSVIGEGTDFAADFAVGDTIVIAGMTGIVAAIDDATQLAAESPFPIDQTFENKGYMKLISGAYIGIPYADGGEKMIVFSVPNIDLATNPTAADTQSDLVTSNHRI